MNRQARRELKRRLSIKIDEAARQAADGSPEVKDTLASIEAYKKLLELGKPKWRSDSLTAIVFALVCLAAAGTLWTLKVSRSNVSVSVDSVNLAGRVAREWNIDNRFIGPAVHLERLSSIQAPNLGVSLVSDQGDAWCRLSGGTIVIQSLRLRPGTRFEASTQDDQVRMYISGAAFDGRLSLVGQGSVQCGAAPGRGQPARRVSVDVPETVEFTSVDPRGVPSALTIHQPRQWALDHVPLADLTFSIEESPQPTATVFTSGIKSGSVQFNDTKWPPIPLAESELLSVAQTDTARIEASNKGGIIHVTVNGFVSGVTIGDAETRRHLAPSYLEYFYNKQTTAFFWSAVVFFWGLLWGVRQTVFR